MRGQRWPYGGEDQLPFVAERLCRCIPRWSSAGLMEKTSRESRQWTRILEAMKSNIRQKSFARFGASNVLFSSFVFDSRDSRATE